MPKGFPGGKLVFLHLMHFTYVLRCVDNKRRLSKFYIGSTSDIESRALEHKSGKVTTTKGFDILTLVYYEACLNKTDARKRELQLKTGFGRGYLNNRLENFLNEARE